MSKTYESLEPQGHFNFAKRVFQKIKGYIDSKVQTDVPANATFTDTKVTQTQDNSTNDNFEILLAGSTSNTTATEEAKKTNSITFNPSQQAITIGSRKSGSTIGLTSFASGYNVEASKTCSHAEGYSTKASGPSAHSEGSDTTASGTYSHAEGYNTTASGAQSHAEGTNTTASSQNAHAEGYSTTASGSYSHAEGYYTTASGNQSHAEGSSTTASGDFAHTEGGGTEASGDCAHAEGGGTKAIGASTHAEGLYTRASGSCSHAEGYYTTASGESSHAEGGNTEASGIFAHAEGLYTVANHESQHVFGEYNIADPSSATASSRGNYVEIVGNGDSSTRSNARTLDWNGNEVLSGKLTVGAAPTNNMDVTTKQYVDTGLAGAIPVSEKGANSGVATLDSTGKVPSSQLPTISNYTATGNIDISQQNVISRREVWLNSMSDYNALSSVDPDTDYHVKGSFAITFSANKVIITDNDGNLVASNVTTEKLNQASDLTEAYRAVNGELYVVWDDGL